uniref:Uncharacterized protein n=1 Tax=Rhodnius prolixus TaxID=13249 RepID=T1HRQ3_RHOPR
MISVFHSLIYKGVLIQEVDEGQPCSACDKCVGFEPHIWR